MIQHTEQSSYREKMIEHLFIGELLKISWIKKNCSLEVSKPEVDRTGYDVIAEANGVIRHIQLKASYVGGKTARQKVHIQLCEKPSGCVVWIYFNQDTLELGPFLFYGGDRNAPMNLTGAKVARHTKGNQDGYKGERPNLRELNKGKFERYENVESLYDALFEKGHAKQSPEESVEVSEC